MFEASLIPILRTDSLLAACVTSYGGASAIFSDGAPENAELPYAVVIIDETETGDSIVASFTITIDFYEQTESSANARAFVKRCIDLLDRRWIDSDTEYHRIRIFSQDFRRIDEGDPRDVHYRLQFSARAGRRRFIESITTDGE